MFTHSACDSLEKDENGTEITDKIWLNLILIIQISPVILIFCSSWAANYTHFTEGIL